MAMITETDQSRIKQVDRDRSVILAENLTKRFGTETAIENVTLYVPTGSIFGFIGPSGSGKTTTIRMLTGVYRPTEGEVTVFGIPPTKFNPSMRARLGYMPQLFVLYPNLTLWENLNFAASLYGMPPGRGRRLKEILEFVELYKDRNKIARNTSGGMQRRLSLAATLIHDPELVFLDEPTAGIDPILRRKFWDHFKDLQEQGRTLFVTTQYVNEASYCDIVGVMGEGRLIVVDTPEGLRHRAFHGEMVDVTVKEPVTYALEAQMRELPPVKRVIGRISQMTIRLLVDEASTAIPEIIEWSQSQNMDVEAIEEYLPPFDDVFVELVHQNGGVK